MYSFFEKVYLLVIRHPRKLLWSLVVITALFGYGATLTHFNQSYSEFFPKSSPEYKDYERLLNSFEADNNFLFITASSASGIFHEKSIQAIRRLTKTLEGLPETASVLSVTNVFNPILSPTGQLYKKYYITSKKKYKQDSLRIINEPFLNGLIISKDKNKTALFLKHHNIADYDSSRLYLEKVEKIVASEGTLKTNVIGRIKAEIGLLDLMDSEFNTSILLLCIFLIILLWLVFRNITLTLFSSIIIIVPMVWLIGIIAYLGVSINIISLVLPAIVLTIGTSDVIHIVTHYGQAWQDTKDKKKALYEVVTKLGLSIFLTSLTTCLGFLSLNNASLVPVQNMGNHAALGVMLAFLCALLYFPCILYLSKKNLISKKRRSTAWRAILSKLFVFSLRKKNSLITSTVLIILAALLGISVLRVDTYLLEDLKESHPLKKDFQYLDSNYTGIRSFELLVLLKDTTSGFFQREVLVEIDSISAFAERELGVRHIISPTLLAKKINRSLNYGKLSEEKLPDSIEKIASYVSLIGGNLNDFPVIAKDGKVGRISGKMSDIGSEKGLQLYNKFQQYLQKKPPVYADYQWTGTAYMVDLNNQLLVGNMIKGLGIGALLIGLCILLMMRSIKLTLLSIIVNSLPIIITAGIMGAFDVRIRLVTIIVFAVAFGISIDNLIHFLARYRIERKRMTTLYAIKNTFFSTGQAIITSSSLLIVGFLSLLTSDFEGIFAVGLFIALPLFIGMVSVLMLMPSLLYYTQRKSS